MDDYTVKSVDKALLLLEVVSKFPHGITITDLAMQVGMYKSTVHRLLGTMIQRGFIEQDKETGKYKLGYTILDLGMRLLSSIDLRKEALPYLQELSMKAGEVVHLALLDKGEVVYIEKVESTNTIRMHSRVGNRAPVHATGLGKAILAFLPQKEALAIVKKYGLSKLTEYTIADEYQLMESLAKIKQNGYAFDIQENELGVSCVAAPILDNTSRVAAACSVSGPINRMTMERLCELIPYVTGTARLISERLGYTSGLT